MATAAPRLGRMDALTVRILKDIVLMMDDDPYLDEFEELVEGPILDADGDMGEDAEEVWQTELDRVEARVLNRVGRALVNMTSDHGEGDRLVRELHRQLRIQDDTQEEEEPHVILVHTPEAHLVRQV